MGQLAVMGRQGDTKIIWDPENEDEVANARRTFNELVTDRRFKAFRVRERGAKGEAIDEFDPAAEKLIIVPPMAGGR